MAEQKAHAEHAEHIVPNSTNFTVFAILMVLLAATVGVAYVPLGEFNIVVAMTIAVVKAVLVLLYFMHVKYSSKLIWLFACAGFFWLILMFGIFFMDYGTRGWIPQPHGL